MTKLSSHSFRVATLCLLFTLVTPLLSQEKKAEKKAAEKPTHIYLLIGQSNMAGRAEISKEDSQPIDRCLLFDDQSKWVPASNPLNRFSTIRKNLGMQKLNPGYSFAKAMLKWDKTATLGLVVNAKGGTKIEQWAKGTPFYNQAVSRTKEAMKDGELKGILWHQGEGNSSMPESYLPKLAKFIADLRKDLERPELPFVAGQIVGDEPINQEVAKLNHLVPCTGVVSSEGLVAFDRWHFDAKSMKLLGERYAATMQMLHTVIPAIRIDEDDLTIDALATRKTFDFNGHRAFVMMPKKKAKSDKIPWVWYAPTLGKNLPGNAEKWMFNRFHRAGIAIAGIDVGESYGSPTGRKTYQAFYEKLTKEDGFSAKPVLLARSRGGLMLYSWASAYPESVGGIAGIYPVCNLASYPGLKRAAGAYELTPEELENRLAEFNPIDRLKPLAKHKVPIFHIHGDVDKVVPLEANTAIIKKNYKEMGGPIEVEVVKGQGHNMWKGWFHSDKLTLFVISNALKK